MIYLMSVISTSIGQQVSPGAGVRSLFLAFLRLAWGHGATTGNRIRWSSVPCHGKGSELYFRIATC